MDETAEIQIFCYVDTIVQAVVNSGTYPLIKVTTPISASNFKNDAKIQCCFDSLTIFSNKIKLAKWLLRITWTHGSSAVLIS